MFQISEGGDWRGEEEKVCLLLLLLLCILRPPVEGGEEKCWEASWARIAWLAGNRSNAVLAAEAHLPSHSLWQRLKCVHRRGKVGSGEARGMGPPPHPTLSVSP